MITASEAREKTNLIGAMATNYIKDVVEPSVMQAIDKGENCCLIYIDSLESWRIPSSSAMHSEVMRELRSLGYAVVYSFSGTEYVPPGLSDDDGNGPKHRNVSIKITW